MINFQFISVKMVRWRCLLKTFFRIKEIFSDFLRIECFKIPIFYYYLSMKIQIFIRISEIQCKMKSFFLIFEKMGEIRVQDITNCSVTDFTSAFLRTKEIFDEKLC